MRKIGFTKIIILAFVWIQASVEAQEPKQPEQQPEQQIVAKVGEVAIPVNDYLQNLLQAARSTFYHGKPPESEFVALREKVVEQMVDRILLVNEARSRGTSFDQQRVEHRLERLINQHQQSESITDEVKESLRVTLREEDIINQMRQSVQDSTSVTDQGVGQFYKENPDLFTMPNQSSISMILLKVDPSSPQSAWEAAINESSKLVDLLENGADFAELARIHSADASAEKGGDMGYMHQGMLAPEVQTVLDEMSVGDYSQPVLVLEGIAVFRLNDRKGARLLPLDQVKEWVKKLTLQKKIAENWKKLIEDLRRETTVEINETILSEIRLG